MIRRITRRLPAAYLFFLSYASTGQVVSPVAARPPGIVDGINYTSETSVTLCLLAPFKEHVYVIGDFNDWEVRDDYLMNKTPDGERYWLEINNLVPGQEYRFQYFVDGEIRVGDPYADKFIDNWTDPDIPEEVYPNLIGYPEGKTEYPVSVFQTAQEPYPWEVEAFTPPAREKMFIYEMCIRDFVDTHAYKTVTDTLDYLQELGVNVLELMPITDFDGNLSWGYNPNYYFAPDKYFGPKNALKKLIDECHKRGMAVTLDMVLNHSWGQNPLVRLYWNGAPVFEPTEENPWFNVGCNFENELACFGPDYDHESPYTQDWVDSVNAYWLTEYKVDGFRFDFTKGFTNEYKSMDDKWGDAYDASRIAILKRMADAIWEVKPEAIVMLEHLSFNNEEERELANHGMLLWANFNYHYRQLITGNPASLSWMSYKDRDWDAPNAVAYWGSHDWERLMYEALHNGKGNLFYDIRNKSTALDRMKLCAAFLYTMPGPKMIWMFDELGYDETAGEGTPAYGAPYPIHWEYYDDPERYKLYRVISEIVHLKQNLEVFASDDFGYSADGITKSFHLNGEAMNVTIIGNFDITEQPVVPAFQHTGTWYDFFTGGEYEVTDTHDPVVLEPGAFHIFLDQPVDFPEPGLVTFSVERIPTGIEDLVRERGAVVYPNPSDRIFNLHVSQPIANEKDLLVYDTLGQVYHPVILQNNPLHYQLNFEKLPSGIYLIQWKAGEQMLRVVKQ